MTPGETALVFGFLGSCLGALVAVRYLAYKEYLKRKRDRLHKN